MKIVNQSASLEWITPNALEVIERAGRTCYKSEGKMTDGSAETFIRSIIARGHESVIEHASASFRIICDRGVSHELVRHRLASYSQESTRYCNYRKTAGEITVIKPPGMNLDQELEWEEAVELAEDAYLAMLQSGLSPQIARSVLPTCLKTEVVMTANFREWRHFLRLRLALAAHPQMREVARCIQITLYGHVPAVFG